MKSPGPSAFPPHPSAFPPDLSAFPPYHLSGEAREAAGSRNSSFLPEEMKEGVRGAAGVTCCGLPQPRVLSIAW